MIYFLGTALMTSAGGFIAFIYWERGPTLAGVGASYSLVFCTAARALALKGLGGGAGLISGWLYC